MPSSASNVIQDQNLRAFRSRVVWYAHGLFRSGQAVPPNAVNLPVSAPNNPLRIRRARLLSSLVCSCGPIDNMAAAQWRRPSGCIPRPSRAQQGSRRLVSLSRFVIALSRVIPLPRQSLVRRGSWSSPIVSTADLPLAFALHDLGNVSTPLKSTESLKITADSADPMRGELRFRLPDVVLVSEKRVLEIRSAEESSCVLQSLSSPPILDRGAKTSFNQVCHGLTTVGMAARVRQSHSHGKDAKAAPPEFHFEEGDGPGLYRGGNSLRCVVVVQSSNCRRCPSRPSASSSPANVCVAGGGRSFDLRRNRPGA